MRKAFSIILIVLLTLALLALLGVWQLNRSLQAFGIEQLDYRLQELGLHQLGFSQLSLVYNTESIRTSISLSDATFSWHWPSGWAPKLLAVDVEQLQLTYSTRESEFTAEKASQSFTLPDKWSIPNALPKHLLIKDFLASAPCPAGICSLAGSLAMEVNPQALGLTLAASPGKVFNSGHRLQFTAGYRVRENFPQLDARLMLDQSVDVHLQTQLVQDQEMYWSGSLRGQAGYPDAWWRAAFSDWGIRLSPEWDDAVQQPVVLTSEWNLALMPLVNLLNDEDNSLWQEAFTGRLSFDATVPVPIGIRDLGDFSGRANIELAATAGQIAHYQLLANIAANNLVIPESLKARGLTIDAAQLAITSAVNESVSLARVPVDIDVSIQGAVQGKSSARLVVDIFDKKIIAEAFDSSITAKKIVPTADLTLQNVQLDLHASGIWQPDKFEAKIAQTSQLSADVDAPGFSMKATSAQWASSQFAISGNIEQGQMLWPTLEFNSIFSVAIGHLSHPQLHPKSWHWQADIRGQLEQFRVAGELAVDNSLKVKHQLERESSGLTLKWQLPDIFLLAGNPFADAATAWPSLLTFAQGKIKAEGDLLFDLEKNHLTKSQAIIQLNDVSGIYDTVTFQGVTTNVNIQTRPRTLALATDEIKIKQLSKGFSAGPLVASASYQADLEQPAQGKLDLQYFHGDLMGGTVSTPAQIFNFSDEKQRVVVELKNVDLATLLKQHPSTEISGNGRLSGKIPIDISGKGISVARGVVSAEPPGGQLQYHSPRAAAIAQKQPSMKLITEALDDFHYSVLASEVNYDKNGKLLLSITLQGKNPAVEKGRPINFNINLEEDLPAMITSIQLANNISDIIKRRLQERLQKKR